MLVLRTADEAGARELLGSLRPAVLTWLWTQGGHMGDLIEKCARLPEQGQQWLKREEELVGVLLWTVGVTIVAFLPDTGVFIPVHSPVFLGLKIVAAFLWLIFGEKCLQRFKKRETHEP
jgi:purine-cytosine permease-like protein